jgi:hypothetical protein
VIGPGRSGTTPVRFLLNAHPDCFIMHEGLFIRRFLEAERRNVRINIPHHHLKAPVKDGKPERHWRETRQFVWGPDHSNLPTVHDACYALRRTYPPVQVFGDKLPGASSDWQRTKQILPNAQFIVTLRDEAAILRSIKRRAERDPRFGKIMRTRGDLAEHVRQSLRQAQRCADITGACVVTGDELDADAVRRMLEHAGLDEATYDWEAANTILTEGARVS